MHDTMTLSDTQFDRFLHEMAQRLDPVLAAKAQSLVAEIGGGGGGGSLMRRAVLPGAEAKAPERAGARFLKALLADDRLATKALSEGADAAGGYLVPADFREDVIARLAETSELAPFVTVVPVSADAGGIPSLATDISITWRAGSSAENTSFAESNPVFATVPWLLKRADAFTKISRELVADSRPAVLDFIMRLFREGIARERDRMIAIGNGSTQPAGLAVASGMQELTSVGPLDFDTLVEAEQTLRRKYRTRARWIMNGTNLHRIFALTDTVGRPLFTREVVGGVPESRILGYPVSQQDDLGDGEIYFGDLSYYFWFDRGEMGIESTTTGGDAFANHQAWIKVWERVDGRVALPEAFVKASGITG